MSNYNLKQPLLENSAKKNLRHGSQSLYVPNKINIPVNQQKYAPIPTPGTEIHYGNEAKGGKKTRKTTIKPRKTTRKTTTKPRKTTTHKAVRCTAKTSDGKKCKCTTTRGKHCHHHRR